MVRNIFDWKRDSTAFERIDAFETELTIVESWFAAKTSLCPYPAFHPDD
jgi:hypothetical protein